ncbi:MAG: hypothetical protein GX456_01570, partial [Verrucomicrobia bacterium]|nr:hypothetical protein [Verrucomicrobiota bacterium]
KNARAPTARSKKQRRRERGRPRPHQPDDRSYTRFNQANPTPERSPVWCGEESPRSCSALEKATAVGSAAVPGRINPTTDLIPVSFTQIRRPNVHRLGAGKNARAPTARSKKQRRQERGRPRPHQSDDQPYDPFRSCKSCARMFTGWGWARMPALPQRVRNSNGTGCAAVPGRINPTTDLTPVSFTQIRRPNGHRRGAQTTCLSPYRTALTGLRRIAR